MKVFSSDPRSNAGNPGEKGSAAYSFIGWAIIVVVVLAAILSWDKITKGTGTSVKDTKLEKALAEKNWDGALVVYDGIIQKDQKNVPAFIGRAFVLQSQGKLDKALDDAKKAVALDPKSAAAFARRGMILKLQRKNDEALKDFNQAVNLDTRFAWAMAQKADLLMRQKDLEKSLETVNKALAIQSTFPEAVRLRAAVLARMGKCKEAFEDYHKVSQMQPENSAALQDTAWFLLTCPDEKLVDKNKALELASKAIAKGQNDAFANETMAEANFQQNDALKAVEYQKKAIELQIKNCPDGSCVQAMQERLKKYELAARKEVRDDYEILPLTDAPVKAAPAPAPAAKKK